ncbi:MAG: acyl-CoA N-acyltransferase [candidate division WOR-3 bacterium]
MALRVVEVTTEGQLKTFIDLPWQVYRGNRCWVPPLKRDVRHILDTARHPFWEHARRVLFLAELDGRPVGRISAHIDDNYNNLWHERLGSFGFFECPDDQQVASALFDAAAEWVRGQGMSVLRGPMSPSSNDEWGWLLDAFDQPPVLMMPYNPPYYHRLAENWGLTKAKDLLAFIKYASSPMPERLTALALKLRANPRITLRPVNMKDLKGEMAIIRELYNESWQQNWGFAPMTDKEMDLLAANLKTFAEPGMVLFAFYDGNPAGLSITLPDMNQVLIHLNGRLGPIEMVRFLFLRRRITGSRALVFGFKQQYRRLGLPVLLFYETEQYMRRRGYQWCELSWNLEDNRLINDFDRELGAEVYKHYRVYEKALQ